MSSLRLDQSLPALRKGYGWLPDARREVASDTVRTRVLGQRAVALCGPAAARFFYDETHVRRSTAIPLPVQDTLFGRGAVHTLDADAHRRRKELFLSLLGPDGVRSVADEVATTWDAAA